MLRQFTSRLQPSAKASGSKLLRRAAGLSMPRRSLATVSIEGIPKVRFSTPLFAD